MSRRPLPDWLLERYRLGELPAEELEEVRRALAHDAHARHRLDALDASDRRILDAHPPGPTVGAIRRRAQGSRAAGARLPRWLVLVPALATALVVFVAIRPPGREIADRPGAVADESRAKGLRPRLLVYRVVDRRAEALADGAAARRGDTLQLAYVSGGRRYGAIVSLDGRGQVTLHLPAADGSAAVALQGQRETPLPRAYELDDAPAFERFFLVTSDAPFATDTVLAAGRTLASSSRAETGLLALPAHLDQTALSLRKVTP